MVRIIACLGIAYLFTRVQKWKSRICTLYNFEQRCCQVHTALLGAV